MDTDIKVGSVLCSTWGYEQTNADFYKVTKVHNGWVTFQHIGTQEESDGGFMTAEMLQGDSKSYSIADHFQVVTYGLGQ